MSTSNHSYEIAYRAPVPEATAANWYAVHTRARHEKMVGYRLQQQGMTTFLPLISEVHRWSDRRKKVELPLFSSYVFVQLIPTNEQRMRVLRLDGVFRFVGSSRGEGIPVPDEQIEAVRTLIAQDLPWSNHPFLKIGQRVRIRGGALDGVEGVLRSRDGEDTLVVSIDAIQRSLAVRIEGYDVEPC